MSVNGWVQNFLLSLLFIAPGAALMLCAGKIARYNRDMREFHLREAQRKVEEGNGLAKVTLSLMRGSLESGKMDQPMFFLVGLAAVALGFYAWLHPNGW